MEKELVYGPIENKINGPDLQQHELKEFCRKMSLKWYFRKKKKQQTLAKHLLDESFFGNFPPKSQFRVIFQPD